MQKKKGTFRIVKNMVASATIDGRIKFREYHFIENFVKIQGIKVERLKEYIEQKGIMITENLCGAGTFQLSETSHLENV